MKQLPQSRLPVDGDRHARDRALFARYRRDGDPAVKDALVARFLPLAQHLARRYAARDHPDDLAQVASIGLLKAIERFDPDHGSAFSSFAVPTITGELRRHLRDRTWTVRVPRPLQELSLRTHHAVDELTGELGRSPTPAEIARRCEASVEQVLEALVSTTAHRPISLDLPLGELSNETIGTVHGRPDPELEQIETTADVDALLRVLPERERLILELRFRHCLTQAEIGERVGLSQMHVSRVIRTSLEVLREQATAADGLLRSNGPARPTPWT